MTLIARGVIAGLGLNPEEIAVVNNNVKYCTIRTISGESFLVELELLVRQHQPDLVRLHPLTAFIGADPKETEVIQNFLRTGVTSIAVKYNCGMVIVHHTENQLSRYFHMETKRLDVRLCWCRRHHQLG